MSHFFLIRFVSSIRGHNCKNLRHRCCIFYSSSFVQKFCFKENTDIGTNCVGKHVADYPSKILNLFGTMASDFHKHSATHMPQNLHGHKMISKKYSTIFLPENFNQI
jgi:hypothetical protein